MNNNEKLLLAALGLLGFFNGAFDQYWNSGVVLSPVDMVFTVATTIVLFSWYYLDARRIGYRRGVPLDIAVIAVGLIALPYYFLRSRGIRKGALYVGGFVLIVIAWLLLEKTGAYAAYYGLQR